MQEGFARMENRLDQIYNHVDGFMKLHETLDIEFRVIKDSASRVERWRMNVTWLADLACLRQAAHCR